MFVIADRSNCRPVRCVVNVVNVCQIIYNVARCLLMSCLTEYFLCATNRLRDYFQKFAFASFMTFTTTFVDSLSFLQSPVCHYVLAVIPIIPKKSTVSNSVTILVLFL